MTRTGKWLAAGVAAMIASSAVTAGALGATTGVWTGGHHNDRQFARGGDDTQTEDNHSGGKRNDDTNFVRGGDDTQTEDNHSGGKRNDDINFVRGGDDTQTEDNHSGGKRNDDTNLA